MSVVHLIDTLKEWAEENICSQITLKQPPKDMDAAEDAGYNNNYTLVTPATFAMYVPTQEKLPPNIHAPFPSLCVRFMSGEDAPNINEGFVDVQFCFSTWSPGTHGKDILNPVGDGTHKEWSGADANRHFERNGEGWRDAWNFVDIALRAVESVTIIGNYTIDRATPVKFGPLTEQEAIPDLYPFWFAWISFRVKYPLVRNIADIQTLL